MKSLIRCAKNECFWGIVGKEGEKDGLERRGGIREMALCKVERVMEGEWLEDRGGEERRGGRERGE